MSIFSRLFKIGQAKANAAIDSLEDTEELIEQAIRDKDEEIRKAKRSVQQVIVSERKAKSDLDGARNAEQEWNEKAEMALRAGNEELAAKALARAGEFEAKAAAFEPIWKEQRGAVEDLKKEILSMQEELETFKRNKDLVIAQSKAGEVKKNIYEAKARMTKKRGADDLMARLKEKSQRQMDEADAAKELATGLDGGDSLEKEFSNLGEGGTSPEVNAKLEALKAKMKGGESQTAGG